jgi:hypothetical protein
LCAYGCFFFFPSCTASMDLRKWLDSGTQAKTAREEFAKKTEEEKVKLRHYQKMEKRKEKERKAAVLEGQRVE